MVQIGRTQDRSLRILITKLDNQKARFLIWGQALGSDDKNSYDQRLDDPVRRDRICQSCKLLHDIFTESSHLRMRYGLQEDIAIDPRSSLQLAGDEGSCEASAWRLTFRRMRARLLPRPTTSYDPSHISRQHIVRWIIKDQKDFLNLVSDVRDLVDDLESLTAFPNVEDKQRRITAFEIESFTDYESIRLVQAASVDEDSIISEVASTRAFSFRDDKSIQETFHTAPERQDFRPRYADEDSIQEAQEELPESLPQNQRLLAALSNLQLSSDAIQSQSTQAHRQAPRSLFDEIHRRNCQLNKEWLASSAEDNTSPRYGRLIVEARSVERMSKIDFVTWHFLSRGSTVMALATFLGPMDSPYEEGLFNVLLIIPLNYPFKPPLVHLLMKVYHPNIDSRGIVCLDMLADNWSPVNYVETILVSLVSLLDEPFADDPIVPEIAATYITDRKRYNENARLYTRRHATGVLPAYQQLWAIADDQARELARREQTG